MPDPTTDAPLVARVAVDVSLPHLDRAFDYLVPDADRDRIAPGVRVRVRFAGKLADGFVLALSDTSDAEAKLRPLERVVSDEVVLSPAVVRLARAVADHYGGTLADVLRMAVPGRHAATEQARRPEHPAPSISTARDVLPLFPGGDAFLDALAAGRPLRAAWLPVPVHGTPGEWVAGLVEATAATLASGRGALLIVADADALGALEAGCSAAFGRGSFVTLSAELGPAARYRSFLAASRGEVRLVLGTRNAVFAPVRDLGLVAVWDEGNDSLAEPRAPYWHAREVAALRAAQGRTALLIAGYARTAETEALVQRGWLGPLQQKPAENRRLGPAVRIASDGVLALERDPAARSARLPHDVFAAVRSGLARGPVLLQVPRAGYLAALSCESCREPARCPACSRVLGAQPTQGRLALSCGTCGPRPEPWRCPSCGSDRLRAPRVGVRRTAEELGRAFPQTRVVESWGGRTIDRVPDEPALVLATPGAEPVADGGYATAVLLDTALLLARPELRAAEEALRRWLTVAALVRPGSADGTVVAVGETDSRALQALVRLDPAGFAARELDERRQTGFPPAAKVVTVEGARPSVDAVASLVRSLAGVELFGPAPVDDDSWRLTARSSLADARGLLDLLVREQARRSAVKEPAVRVRVDPWVLD